MGEERPKVELTENPLVLNLPNLFKEENEKPSSLDLNTIKKEVNKNDSKITIDLSKNKDEKDYKNINASAYKELQNKLKLLVEKNGFSLSQTTGLKAAKYAYFKCSFFEERKTNLVSNDETVVEKEKENQSKNFFLLFCNL